MSYEKHTWETGETITAEKLNNLENGVASSGEGNGDIFKVNFVMESGSNNIVSNKTQKDICDAFDEDKPVFGFARIGGGGVYCLSSVYYNDDYYSTTFFSVTPQGIMLMKPVNNTADNTLWNTTKMTIN